MRILLILLGLALLTAGGGLLARVVPHEDWVQMQYVQVHLPVETGLEATQLVFDVGRPWGLGRVSLSATRFLQLYILTLTVFLLLWPTSRDLLRYLLGSTRRWLTALFTLAAFIFTLWPAGTINAPHTWPITVYLLLGSLACLFLLAGLNALYAAICRAVSPGGPMYRLRAGTTSPPPSRSGLVVTRALGMVWVWLSFIVRRCPLWLFLTVLFAVQLAVCAWYSHQLFDRVPHVVDGIAQLFHARIFALGRLTAPAPPLPEFFELQHVIINSGRWYSQYPPGHTFLLMLGVLAGQPWLVNPILGACTTLAMYLGGRELYGDVTGRLAAILTLLSPFIVFMSSEYMNHTTALLGFVLFAWQFARGLRTGSLVSGMLAGLAGGYLVLTRPFAAAALLLPFGVYALWLMLPFKGGTKTRLRGESGNISPAMDGEIDTRSYPSPSPRERSASITSRVRVGGENVITSKSHNVKIPLSSPNIVETCARRSTNGGEDALGFASRLPPLAGMLVVGLAMLGVLLWFNWATNGSPFLFGYEVKHGTGHNPGFGHSGWGPEHSLTRGVEQTLNNLSALNKFLFEWPIPSLAFVALFFACGRVKKWDVLLLASCVSLAAAHLCYWYQDWAFGPRFLYEASGPLILLTVRGMQALPEQITLAAATVSDSKGLLPAGNNRYAAATPPFLAAPVMQKKRLVKLATLTLVLVCLTCSFLGHRSQLLKNYQNYWQINAQVLRAVQEKGVTHALVFCETGFVSVFAYNPPLLDGPVIFVRNMGTRNSKLAKQFPSRSCYLEVDGHLYLTKQYDAKSAATAPHPKDATATDHR